MWNRLPSTLAVAGFLVLLAACSPGSPAADTRQATATVAVPGKAGGYQTLTIDAFAEILASNKKDYTVVNVHIPYEGEIEGTDAKLAYNDLNALMAALPDKNAPIILYCRSGRMSEIASKALAEKGYTQVWDVPGGMIAWQASGRNVIEK